MSSLPTIEKAPPPLVLVVWEDAKTVDGGAWIENLEHKYDPHIVYSVGFLLLDLPEGIQLTQAWHPKFVGAPDQIPRGMIRSITPLVPAVPPGKPKRRKHAEDTG